MYLGSNKHKKNLEKARQKANSIKIKCLHCSKDFVKGNFKRHEETCHLNPKIMRLCVICNKPIKKTGNSGARFKKQMTCSYACSNTYFRSGPDHPNWSDDSYRTTCFHFHEKKCVVCDEANIVEVHHLNENSKDNRPVNLIPLCPTHHQYWHSRYRELIQDKILKYVEDFENFKL